MKKPLLLAALLAALAAGSCSSAAPLAEADEAFARGEYERARALYVEALSDRPGDPLLREKAEVSRKRAVKARLSAAKEATDLGAALAELAAAAALAPGSEEVREAEAELRARHDRAASIAREARAALDAGRAGEARGMLLSLGPDRRLVADSDELLARAEAGRARAAAEARGSRTRELLDAAERALRQEGDVATAVALARAAGGDGALAAPERDRLAALLGELAERHLAVARSHSGAGRVASALLWARAAARLDPGAGDAAAFEGPCRDRWAVRFAIAGVEDGTRGRVDPDRFADQLRDALRPAGLRETPAAEAELSVRILVDTVELTAPGPVVEERVHEQLLREEYEVNPEHDRAQRAAEAARRRLDRAESLRDAVKEEVWSLARLEGSARIHRTGGDRLFGPYTEPAYYRLLGDARAREAEAEAAVARLTEQWAAAERRAREVPLYLASKVIGRVPYEERTVSKSVSARAVLSFDSKSPDVPGGAAVAATVTQTDRVVAGRPEVGLPADPEELPTDGEVADEALRRLAGEAAGRIRLAAAETRRQLILTAREAEDAGDRDGALELYAAFVYAAGDELSLECASAARKLETAWGLDAGLLRDAGGED